MKKISEINEKNINDKLLDTCSVKHFNHIKYFHPNGEIMKDGVYVYKGFFNETCLKNMNSFNSVLTEKISDEQYGLRDYRGGIVIFSTDVNAEKLSDSKIINKIRQFITTLKNRHTKNKMIDKIIKMFNNEKNKLVDENIFNYMIGHAFTGRYQSLDGDIFDEKSITVEVNGISSSGLLLLAEFICKSFKEEVVLVKDINVNKIYLADREKFSGSIEDLKHQLDNLNIKSK